MFYNLGFGLFYNLGFGLLLNLGFGLFYNLGFYLFFNRLFQQLFALCLFLVYSPFLNAGRLSTAPAQVIKLGTAYLAVAHDFYLLHQRGIQREGALDANTLENVSHREAGTITAAPQPDDHPLKYLDAFPAALHYLGADLYRIPGGKLRDFAIWFDFD